MRKPNTVIQHRLAGFLYFILPLLITGLFLRVGFMYLTWPDIPHGLILLGALLVGLFADLVYASYFLLPAALYLSLVPERVFQHPAHRIMVGITLVGAIWVILFTAMSEWIFWSEFGTRFNFIAVDYLVYTTEVIDNILESYPVYPVLIGLILVAGLVAFSITRLGGYQRRLTTSTTSIQSRFAVLGAILLVSILATATVDAHNLPKFDNKYVQEISRNGPYSFFAAFRDNELDFHEFYVDEPPHVAAQHIRPLIKQQDARFIEGALYPERRRITHGGGELRYNVIQIVVESLSADFMGTFGQTDGLTPNLDNLARQSLLFTNFMATGTRTVRGMESMTLSVPPTPGRSIVKRPENDRMFSVGTVLRRKGYQPSFFYGGYGYFDNMNDFFSGNGFSVHDRATEATENVAFSNAWGVSDEDLFGWVLDNADLQFASRQPFFDFVMTTSNHRPYTYPDDRIDIPSHSGRAGAVKYTDYAIGNFLAEARQKPWFDHTIFVIVADHCAGSAGKTQLPVKNYRIPLLIYAPGIVAPSEVDTLSSQIDLAPTLFSILQWSYDSEFFGRDILQIRNADGRALIGNYQNIGLLSGNSQLTILTPGKQTDAYRYDAESRDQQRIDVAQSSLIDTITYYQRSADLFRYRSGDNT